MTDLVKAQDAELIAVTSTPAAQNPALVYLAGLAQGSHRTMRQALDTIARLVADGTDHRSFPWHALRFQHTQAIRAQLAGKYEAATANKILSALRGVLKAAWRLGLMTTEDYGRASDIQSIRGSTVTAGRELASGELAALMRMCGQDSSAAGARDAAVIAVMYAVGLRREEVVTLDVSDYDSETGRLVIRGKGNKTRTSYLNNGAQDALEDWLTIRGSEAGALFVAVNKGGKIGTQRISAQSIYNLLKKRGEEAGLKDFSPHDMRRTFVSDLLDAGADIATVAKMAGHANIQTTARYDRRPEEAKRKAANLLHVPYHKR